MVIRPYGYGLWGGRRRRWLPVINQWAHVVRRERIQAVGMAIKGDEAVLAKVREPGGRSVPVRIGIGPVTWRAARRCRPGAR